MNERDRALMTKIFASYYRQADLGVVAPEQREFGVGFTRKIESRHLSFGSSAELQKYLSNNTPFFVSHSTSYYDFPAAAPMEKKGWKGADLVFDLDIHAEGKYGAYAHLERVRGDLVRLVDDFIKGDFGCREVALNFSGSRGYHVHVRDKAIRALGSDERHELVDYVLGAGLNYLDFFTTGDTKPPKLFGPRPDEGGYRGRFARGVLRVLEHNPASLSRKFTDAKNRGFFVSGIKEGNWSRSSLKYEDLKARVKSVADALPVTSVDTDAGVTHDLSKLIRVPNSIHGDTGLVAKVFADAGRFEPLRDALLPSTQEVKASFSEDVPTLGMGGETIGPFKKGDEKALNLAVAAFFVLKGSATLAVKS